MPYNAFRCRLDLPVFFMNGRFGTLKYAERHKDFWGQLTFRALAPICEGIVLSHHVLMAVLQINANSTMGQKILLRYMLTTYQDFLNSLILPRLTVQT